MAAGIQPLFQHPALWRGDDCAFESATIPSGFVALDAVLPGNGWPQAALTELLPQCEGIGELRLTLPALRSLSAQARNIVWIAPPYLPYAPALSAAGIDPRRFFVVRTETIADRLWAYEQALKSRECGAVFAWLGVRDDRVLRRLQLAAREGNTWGVIWRRPGESPAPSPAALRLALAPRDAQLQVTVLKRRGSDVARPILLDVRGVSDMRSTRLNVRSVNDPCSTRIEAVHGPIVHRAALSPATH